MDEDREGSINAMGKIESHSQFAWLGMLVASTCLSWIITRRMVVVSIYIYIVNSCDWMGEELP